MTPELAAAIEKARHHKMTPQERFEQRVSFVYGQQDWSSGCTRSKDDIRQHMIDLYGYPDASVAGTGTAKTAQPVEGEACQNGPQGDAQSTSAPSSHHNKNRETQS